MDQSKLTKKEQDNLFDLLRKAGQQPTSNMGETTPISAPDLQAQGGEDIHPAVHQIASSMGLPLGPQAPEGVSAATGPKMTYDSNGQLILNAPSQNPLLKLFGAQQHIPINNPNYYETAKAKGLLGLAPSGVPQMPDGSPFIGKTALDQMIAASQLNGKKPSFTKEQLQVIMNPNATADDIDKAFHNQTPQDVISDKLRSQGMTDLMTRHNEGQWNKFTQTVVPAVMRGNTAAGVEARKLFATNHAQALLDQIKTQEDGADPQQRAEASMNIASVLMANGVVTQSEIEKLIPKTLWGDVAGVIQYFKDDPTGTRNQAFLDRIQGTVDRQLTVSQDNLKKAVAPAIFGFAHLRNQDSKRFDNEIMAAANQSFTIDNNGRVQPLPDNPQYQGGSSPAPVAGNTPPVSPQRKPIKNAADYLNKFRS